MPVIQRVEHLAKNIEEFIIAGITRDLRSEGIPVVKGLPQLPEVFFGIANYHNGADLGAFAAALSHWPAPR
jgi:hypothetical protein